MFTMKIYCHIHFWAKAAHIYCTALVDLAFCLLWYSKILFTVGLDKTPECDGRTDRQTGP